MAGLGDLSKLVEEAGIEIPTDTPQQKSVSKKSRKAGQGLTMTVRDLEELLTPWADYERDSGLPNYYGRTEDQWRQDNRRIKNELLRAAGDRNEQISILKDNGFSNPRSQYNLLKYLKRNEPLNNERLWIPGSAADEELSKAVLTMSGFAPVNYGNDFDPMGTDLKAEIDGAIRYVDAQQRTQSNRALNLQVTKKDWKGPEIFETSGESLGKAIEMAYNMNPRISEGKLLHTENPDVNTINSSEFRDGGGLTHRKDYLISSERPRDSSRGYKKGPYNRELPEDWTMVDLEKAREILLPMTASQMYDKYGIKANDYKGINLELPEEFIKKELNDRAARLGREPLRQLTRR